MLSNAGFTNVHSMAGGMQAWEGAVASGPPEAGMAYFPDNEKPERIMLLAWLLEEGARRFYQGLAGVPGDDASEGLFSDLAAAERRHGSLIVSHYSEVSAGASGGFPGSAAAGELNDVMESGLRITESLNWARGKSLVEILDFCAAMETNSYDLYVKMERGVKERGLKQMFGALANEEKVHLRRLTSLLEERS